MAHQYQNHVPHKDQVSSALLAPLFSLHWIQYSFLFSYRKLTCNTSKDLSCLKKGLFFGGGCCRPQIRTFGQEVGALYSQDTSTGSRAGLTGCNGRANSNLLVFFSLGGRASFVGVFLRAHKQREGKTDSGLVRQITSSNKISAPSR
jgi:hypothetical protein